MFQLLAGRLGVPVLLVSLQSRPVLLLPDCEVGEEGMVRVRVRLVEVVAGQSGHGAGLVGVVVEQVRLVFALLVPLLAARSLLRFGRRTFIARVFGALGSSPAAASAVSLPAAGAQRVAGGCPGQWREAAGGRE